jgi:dsDNA-binding SOS-regulon protein
MAYFIVVDGAIDRSFATRQEAEAYAAEHGDVRVIGDEWITLGEAKHRVERAAAAIEEVSPMLDAARVEELRAHLAELESMLDRALESLGLDPG